MRPDWDGRLTAGLAAAIGAAWLGLSVVAGAGADEPAGSGRSTDGAFIEYLDRGFQERTHYKADYLLDPDWSSTGFDPRNIRFDASGMNLLIEKKRVGNLAFTGAEFQRRGWYGFGRYEVIMKASAEPGLISSFFTHTSDFFGDPHDEIDFELMGKSPRELHVKYFSNGDSPGSVYIPLSFDFSKAYHLYAFEWGPDSIRWFVDGQMVHEARASETGVPMPRTPSRVIANVWTGAGPTTQWTGVARFQSARAQYQCISHVPLGGTGPECSDSFKPPLD